MTTIGLAKNKFGTWGRTDPFFNFGAESFAQIHHTTDVFHWLDSVYQRRRAKKKEGNDYLLVADFFETKDYDGKNKAFKGKTFARWLNNNVKQIEYLFVDLDDLQKQSSLLVFDEVVRRFEQTGLTFRVWPSFSHNNDDLLKYRAVIQLKNPIINDTHTDATRSKKQALDQLSELIGIVITDGSNKTWSQKQGAPLKDDSYAKGQGGALDNKLIQRKEGEKLKLEALPEINKTSATQIINHYIDRDAENLKEEFNCFSALMVLATSVQTGEITEHQAVAYAQKFADVAESERQRQEWGKRNIKRLKAELKKIPKLEVRYTFEDKFKKTVTQIEKRMAKSDKAKLMILDKLEKLYKASDGRVYVKVKMNGQSEILSTGSDAFEDWVRYNFSRMEDNTLLSGTDIKTVVSEINSIARFKGERVDIYLRIAEKDGKIYLDLCNEKRQVLEISSKGHQLLGDSPVLFRRTSDMAELPVPIMRASNDYSLLEKYLNVKSRDDLDMIVSFILASFRPSMPKPILNLTGEAGTGKSMNTRLIRNLIDPAKQKDLLKKEINHKELPTASVSQYLMAYDNMSGISKEGSDLLCVVATGGAMTTRKLFTDTDEIIVDLKKVVILNGIDDISKKQDLVSRTIFVETPKLASEQKKTEADIWEAFNKDYPFIFGSLVNAVSTGLKNKGTDKTSYARMQDFGRFVSECSEALEWSEGYWQEIYPNNQAEGINQSIESDPFASALVDMMEILKQKKTYTWSGTTSQLLEKLASDIWPEDITYNRAWPKYNQTKSRLRRIAPLLNSKDITWKEVRSNGKDLLTLMIE